MVISEFSAISADDIHTAADRIQDIVHRTPLLPSDFFSERYGCQVTFKCENLQKTGAFKLRGAYNKIASLSDDDRAHGLIAASSGNHAQGVAYAARAYGIADNTRIYMPESTPKTKMESTRSYGVDVVLIDGTYDDAARAAHAEADETGATYIEPYNDYDIIAGQGTIGLEIMEDAPDTTTIIVPVGGGGLLSGITLGAQSINQHVRMIGVQARYANPSGYTIADGIRVAHPGDKPQTIINERVDRLIKVDEDAIAHAVKLIAQHAKVLVEGSGAVGIAALETGALSVDPDDHIIIVLSGGNIDLSDWQSIVNR